MEFGLRHGVDVVAISFVRSASMCGQNLIQARKSSVPVITKLESHRPSISSKKFLKPDGVMVARGDGVELPPEQVPVIQKHDCARGGMAQAGDYRDADA